MKQVSTKSKVSKIRPRRIKFECQYSHGKQYTWHYGGTFDSLEQAKSHAEKQLVPYNTCVRILVLKEFVTSKLNLK